MKPIVATRLLVLLVCTLLIMSAFVGLFWKEAGIATSARSIDGREIILYGRGAYANHSISRAGSYMGTDITMLVTVAPLLLLAIILLKKTPKSFFVLAGGLMVVCYYSISLVFGAAFNRFFLLYTALFSVAILTFGYVIRLLQGLTWRHGEETKKKYGTAVFLFLAGASALIWLTVIIPGMLSGDFSAFIDINTTEPTFALDIGIIFPFFVVCGFSLLRRGRFGYLFTPVLLTFYSLVGVLVVVQTMVQWSFGIEIPLPQLISFVIVFMVLGLISLFLNLRFMGSENKVTDVHNVYM